MVELYFLLYRVPKMMSQAARESHRRALSWSVIGIVVWLVTEFAGALAFRIAYLIFAGPLDLPDTMPGGLKFIGYVLTLGTAIVSVLLVRRFLLSTTKEHSYPLPPPPPAFGQ
ncbi:MAG TPA: hypothetical protein VIG25_10735 [Pyrinomonadaceae bacterium]